MSVLSVLNKLAPATDTTTTRLKLGDFQFADFEVPERMSIPARQKTVIHQLIGGKRVIDVLGVEYDAFSWSGIITGAKAGDRVTTLEHMRDAGKVLKLTLGTYSFNVVITRFTPVFEFIYRRPYTLEVAIVERTDAPVRADTLTGALDALVNSDLGKALDLASIAGSSSVKGATTKATSLIGEVKTAVSTVQSAINGVKNFASATIDEVQTVVRPIVAAQKLVSQSITQVETEANSIATLGGLVPGNPISKTITNLATQAQTAVQLPALYQLQSVLGRLSKNVQSGQTADGVKTITHSGGNLFQLASEYYDDVSKWISLYITNHFTDTTLTGINTVSIPSNPTSEIETS
ncbi:hypothetical protein [Serratia sp. M24T3]|uniref:hypothetical protein n=1 Tax=Serratia sp. M24T3 TaxID=932213 RepID=UPI00025BB66F|nr:hypothetical protein [Serratia sp. M24T3]EIC83372.1 hypothetical protein SPM24T3_17215 [Serratia sp. M24T3]